MGRKKGRNLSFAKRSFGQNFLIDKNVIDQILEAVDAKEDELIIEIGAGRGALTEGLVRHSGALIGIEIDRDLVPLLRIAFEKYAGFRVVQEDVLNVEFESFPELAEYAGMTKLVGNLPYNISTPVLQKLIGVRLHFKSLTLMLQKEVVERITAPPSTSSRGFLTVLIERYFATEMLFNVPAKAFHPAPKVQSAVLRLIPKAKEYTDGNLFQRLLSVSFLHRRKTLRNNFLAAPAEFQALFPNGVDETLLQVGIDGKRRAESLTLGEWNRLSHAIGKEPL